MSVVISYINKTSSFFYFFYGFKEVGVLLKGEVWAWIIKLPITNRTQRIKDGT